MHDIWNYGAITMNYKAIHSHGRLVHSELDYIWEMINDQTPNPLKPEIFLTVALFAASTQSFIPQFTCMIYFTHQSLHCQLLLLACKKTSLVFAMKKPKSQLAGSITAPDLMKTKFLLRVHLYRVPLIRNTKYTV